jgi:mono/diheme cytochrome c family protein
LAHLWLTDVDEKRLQTAATLYAKNCAACHGETGNGRGPGADTLAAQGIGQHANMALAGEPAAFADPHTMLGGTSDIYYAKIRRGGMGTGMPSFGPIFTPDETWMLVDYLWTFVFDPGEHGELSEKR